MEHVEAHSRHMNMNSATPYTPRSHCSHAVSNTDPWSGNRHAKAGVLSCLRHSTKHLGNCHGWVLHIWDMGGKYAVLDLFLWLCCDGCIYVFMWGYVKIPLKGQSSIYPKKQQEKVEKVPWSGLFVWWWSVFCCLKWRASLSHNVDLLRDLVLLGLFCSVFCMFFSLPVKVSK